MKSFINTHIRAALILAALFYFGCGNNEETPSPLTSPFGPKKIERIKLTFDHEIHAKIKIPEIITGSETSATELETPVHPEGDVISLKISEMPVKIKNTKIENGLLLTEKYGEIEIFLTGLKQGRAVFELRATEKQIIQLKRQIVKYLNNKNELFSAVINNDLTKLKSLINNKVDLNIRTVDEITPLIAATVLNHQRVVQALLEANADVNARDHIGWTALIHFASTDCNPEVGNMLIRANADINARGKQGMTALIMAAVKGNINLVKLLVKEGADLNAAADLPGKNYTALYAAEKEGHTEVSDFLRKSGAK